MSTARPGRFGLIGDPVAHSLSPVFQQAALDAVGIPATYELLHTPEADIPARLEELRSGAFRGVNVTVPHKERFFEAVDERSEIAETIGAVNTILVQAGRLLGDNTDVHGSVQGLVDAGAKLEGAVAIVLGAGGASRAVIAGLLSQNVASIILANRTIERAQSVGDTFGDERVIPVTLSEVREHAPSAALIVNATSIGWHDDSLPIEREVFELLAPGTLAHDLTYQSTAFLRTAAELGLPTLDGLPMLIHQGARSFEIWTGQPAPLDVMWQAVNKVRNP
jgi:shikimate dehydrogenase